MKTERRESEKVPAAWRAWAEQHGSDLLRRALRERYPYLPLLRREIILACCPDVVGASREVDLVSIERLEFGELRTPNAASFAVLDRIDQAIIGADLPPETGVTLGQIHRLNLHHSDGAIRRGAGATVLIVCGAARITTAYYWGVEPS